MHTDDMSRMRNGQSSHNVDDAGAAALLQFDEIVLESNEIDLGDLQASNGFTERRFPQAIYLGIMTEGKRNGRGVMKYANGR